MVIGTPYNALIARSQTARGFLRIFTSEQWTLLGFMSLVLVPLAAHFESPAGYALLLFVHELCDINDGEVYKSQEKGIRNGYGLYLDHMLDSIGACFVAYGTYLLIQSPITCFVGLTLYHLIAIHSWLYKINKVAEGKTEGTYFAVVLSAQRKVWVNVDDLKLLLVLAVVAGWAWLLVVVDAALLSVLIFKLIGAAIELRKTQWHSVPAPN